MRRLTLLAIVVLMFIGLTGLTRAYAQTGGGPSTPLGTSYDLTWWTVDGGGGTSAGNGLSLVGTAGQPDAGALSGGGFLLNGGFWSGVASQYKVYLPVVIK